MINKARLARTFETLVRIDSESRSEAAVCRLLVAMLCDLGAETVVDGAGEIVGGDCGNLVARIAGNRAVVPLMFSAHMDTVAPGKGIEPVLADDRYTSGGETILGADDKSGLAVLLEVLSVLNEEKIGHGPIELVLTVCEETGLEGAKALDPALITAPFGWALDTADVETMVVRAPASNHFTITVIGKRAHSGSRPEAGINAIALAAAAIADAPMGRIDEETTANIGVIYGGAATNIVPDRVTVKGEARSHDTAKLDRVSTDIVGAFETAVAGAGAGASLPRIDVQMDRAYSAFRIGADHPAVTLAQRAAANLGRPLGTKASGGGSDANIFTQKGIVTGVLGTGMQDVHTTDESIGLADMVRSAELVLEIIRIHGAS